MAKVEEGARSLEVWHHQKHGRWEGVPWDDRTPADLLLEGYLDLALELGELERSLDTAEEPGAARRRIGSIREVLYGEEEVDPDAPTGDPWIDEWMKEEADKEETPEDGWKDVEYSEE